MLGSDSRDPDTSTGARTDTIMILHVPASHDRAYIVSLPRDLWVHVPPSPDGSGGNTMAKLNAAYAWGGLPLMVETVEQYTGVRMDHVVLIDFFGFVKVTDALGGVQMNVDQTITSIHPPNRVFTQGPHTFNGTEALDYIRQRYQYNDGDFTREKHQQEFLTALLDKAASAGTLSNPGRFKDFVSSTASALTVDQDFSLVDLGLAVPQPAQLQPGVPDQPERRVRQRRATRALCCPTTTARRRSTTRSPRTPWRTTWPPPGTECGPIPGSAWFDRLTV